MRRIIIALAILAALTGPARAFTREQAIGLYHGGGEGRSIVEVYFGGWLAGVNAYCSIDIGPVVTGRLLIEVMEFIETSSVLVHDTFSSNLTWWLTFTTLGPDGTEVVCDMDTTRGDQP